MNERKVYGMLVRLVREEIIFLDKGYGANKPDKLQEEYRLLQDALVLIERNMQAAHKEDYEIAEEWNRGA